MKYNYLEAVKEALREVVADNDYYLLGMDQEDAAEWLNEYSWNSDSVTGNASGSYTFNRWKAQEYVSENLDLLADALNEFGEGEAEAGRLFLNAEYETMDVIIRLYMLGEAISEVIEELEEAGYFDSQEEEGEAEAAAAAAGC